MIRDWLVSVLAGVKKFLFRDPKPLPKFDPQDRIEEEHLLELINEERVRNGMLPLEEVHELSITAKESARRNYQFNDCTNKPDGMILQMRLLRKEYAADLCGELVNKGAKTVKDCFYSWTMDPKSAGVLKNGYFCHVGIGKCGHFWTAIFTRPRIF